ncbi:YigZ family protein [Rhizobium sp.]|uniref:IMPACT family protein n=1 Tax=Rhizobium sp. TaxID=391 RepID=UPI00289FDC9E
MFQLEQTVTFEQIIKKSRFLAIALPIATEEEARAAIAAHAETGANHNCWAWRIEAAYRFSDDGEPSGTAGKPILAAIDGQSLTNVVVIVTRWFGGILLGSGGLVRAYGGTAAACLRSAPMVELKPSMEGLVRLDFSDLARVKARLQAIVDLGIAEEQFTATGADLVLRVPEAEVETVSRLISDLTSGRSELKID